MIGRKRPAFMPFSLAALTAVDTELYEAASIDGASATRTLFSIKIPMMMPSITICTFLTLTNTFKMFDQNYEGEIKAMLTKILEITKIRDFRFFIIVKLFDIFVLLC